MIFTRSLKHKSFRTHSHSYKHTQTHSRISLSACSRRRSSKCWYYVNVLVFCLFVCLKSVILFLRKLFPLRFHLYPWIAIDFSFCFLDWWFVWPKVQLFYLLVLIHFFKTVCPNLQNPPGFTLVSMFSFPS